MLRDDLSQAVTVSIVILFNLKMTGEDFFMRHIDHSNCMHVWNQQRKMSTLQMWAVLNKCKQ